MPAPTPEPGSDLVNVVVPFKRDEWNALKEAVGEGAPHDYIHDATMDRLLRDEGVRVVLARIKDAPTRAELLTGLALAGD